MRIAAAQVHTAWLDTPRTTSIVTDWLGRAAAEGVELAGEWIVPPVAGIEGLVCADIDLERVREERQNFDPTGHYARPDVLRLEVSRRRLGAVEFDEG